MEIIDNAVMMLVPGAMDADLGSWLFWGSLAFALAVAFVVTVPVNRWLIGRGKGHAVVHQYHGGGQEHGSHGSTRQASPATGTPTTEAISSPGRPAGRLPQELCKNSTAGV
jgi:hypothetical protein